MATQREAAEHVVISARRFRVLAKTGVLPTSKGRGGYNLDEVRLAYIKYLRGIATGQVKDGDGEEASEQDYETLIEQERHRKLKRENDIADGLVAPVDQLTEALTGVLSQQVAILEAIPNNVKRKNPAISARDIEVIKKEIAKARNLAADVTI